MYLSLNKYLEQLTQSYLIKLKKVNFTSGSNFNFAISMAGIYLHIPFCAKKCIYCDFHFSTNVKNNIDAMTKKMIEEIKHRKLELENEKINSIYFGGGTPSLLKKVHLTKFFEEFQAFNINEIKEITMEVNPDDISSQNLSLWKSIGIDRLSIGIQSLDDMQLKWMNRSHNAKQNIHAIQLAKKAGFNNISIDLIYGIPKMSNKEWEKQLDEIKKWEIQHLSAYCLTVENNTALNYYVRKGKTVMPNEETQSEQFKILSNKLSDFGFEHYEISNFSKPNYRAIHNSSYWDRKKYIGIGPSAHSFNGKKRRWNIANNKTYLESSFNEKNWYEEETLSQQDQWNELVLTKLRTIDGINKMELLRFGEIDHDFKKKIDNFVKMKWLKENGNSITLTIEGRLRADYIASELFK